MSTFIVLLSSDNAAGQGFNHLEFKIVVEPADGPSFSVVLLAPSRQEKAAWTSDMSQVQSTPYMQHLFTVYAFVKQTTDSSYETKMHAQESNHLFKLRNAEIQSKPEERKFMFRI